jgi:hypothetical protein
VKILQLRVCTTLQQTIVAVWMQMEVLILKNPAYVTLLPLLQDKCETYFVNFSIVRLVLYRGKRKLLETCTNSESSLHSVLRICTYLLTATLSLNFQPPDSDQYHNQLP